MHCYHRAIIAHCAAWHVACQYVVQYDAKVSVLAVTCSAMSWYCFWQEAEYKRKLKAKRKQRDGLEADLGGARGTGRGGRGGARRGRTDSSGITCLHTFAHCTCKNTQTYAQKCFLHFCARLKN